MRHAFVSVLALALLALGGSRASAQASLVTGLGGPLDFGTDSAPRGDDGSSMAAVDLTPTFPMGVDFYGMHFTDVWVNINGSISFGSPVGSYTPTSFPRTAGAPMIAAWWADVDTRPVPASDPNANQVYWAATPTQFVVTWIDVGYYDRKTDLLNAFQIVLTPAASGIAGAFDVELRYHRCEWTTGDALSSGGMHGLGGHPAQAGIDAGDGMHFYSLPGSLSNAVLLLCDSSNVVPADAGVWHLSSIVPAPVCGNGFQETGEECDDGNTQDHDYCDNTCQLTVPCYTVYPDGAIDFPFPRVDANFGEGGIPDANGDDAFGGIGDLGPLPDLGLSAIDSGIGVVGPCMMPREDGGRRADAGTRFDAGDPVDATMRMDAGPHVNALDVTGGGCGCRAGGARGDGIDALLAGLFVITCLRARARARTRRATRMAG